MVKRGSLFQKGHEEFVQMRSNPYFCCPVREVAQAGSAPGLGPGGRRFESCLPDKNKQCSVYAALFVFTIEVV